MLRMKTVGKVSRFKLYHKIGETSNIHGRTQVFRTLTLAPILSDVKEHGYVSQRLYLLNGIVQA